MNNHLSAAYLRHNARRIRIMRRDTKRGLGYIYVPRNRPDTWAAAKPRVLSVWNTCDDNEFGESYVSRVRVKIAPSMVKADRATLGAYLADNSVISTAFCQHEHDCCGCFYPSGSGRILSRHGRTLVVEQRFSRNV